MRKFQLTCCLFRNITFPKRCLVYEELSYLSPTQRQKSGSTHLVLVAALEHRVVDLQVLALHVESQIHLKESSVESHTHTLKGE